MAIQLKLMKNYPELVAYIISFCLYCSSRIFLFVPDPRVRYCFFFLSQVNLDIMTNSSLDAAVLRSIAAQVSPYMGGSWPLFSLLWFFFSVF